MQVVKKNINSSSVFYREDEIPEAPHQLYPEVYKMDEKLVLLKKEFDFERFTSPVLATRLLEPDEIHNARAEYIPVLEDEIPLLEAEVEQAKLKANEITKTAKDKLDAARTKVKELAWLVNKGTVEVTINNAMYRILGRDKKYYYYAAIEGELMLVKVSTEYINENVFDAKTMEKNTVAFENLVSVNNPLTRAM